MFSEDLSSLCCCMWFPNYTYFPVSFSGACNLCSFWCLLPFSTFFGATTSHQVFLCSQQPPGFKSRLVPHQHSESGVAESSPSGSSPKSWNICCMFYSSLSQPKEKHWVEHFLFFNPTKLCWLQRRAIAGEIQFFLLISMWLFLVLPFPGVLHHLKWFLEFS